MEQTQYLIDTNAISDYLGGRVSEKVLDLMDEVMDNQPAISIINRIELVGHNHPELPQFLLAVACCNVIELTEEIVVQTIALRKSRSIKVPDAIIAATALVYNFTLITHNLSDFKNISNLKLLDLHDL